MFSSFFKINKSFADVSTFLMEYLKTDVKEKHLSRLFYAIKYELQYLRRLSSLQHFNFQALIIMQKMNR